jgi:hypothetical protein
VTIKYSAVYVRFVLYSGINSVTMKLRLSEVCAYEEVNVGNCVSGVIVLLVVSVT